MCLQNFEKINSRYIFMTDFIRQVVRQSDFDNFVEEGLREGDDLEEAVINAVSTFEDEGNFDLSGIFIYRNQQERDIKVKTERNLSTIENCSNGTDTFVNASFCLQGLTQTLNAGVAGAFLLCESRRVVNFLINMLPVASSEDEDMSGAIGEEGDSEDDEEEDKIVRCEGSLGMLLYLCREGIVKGRYRDAVSFLTLDEPVMTRFCGCMDDNISEVRVVILVLDILHFILKVEPNRALFCAAGGREHLDLAAMMHKKKPDVVANVVALLALLD